MKLRFCKNFILMNFVFFIFQKFLIAMPGADQIISVPDALPVVTELPTTPTPAKPSTPTVVTPAPTLGVLAAPVTTATVPNVYSSDKDMVNAVNEATLASTSIYSEVANQKSRLLIYEALLRTLLTFSQKITYEIKQKIFSGFVFDLIDPALQTDLITDIALNKLISLEAEFEKFLLKTRDEVSKLTSPDASRLSKLFNSIYTTMLGRKAALTQKIKKQTNFLDMLDKTQQIMPDKIDEKLNNYKAIISQISKSIILSSRQRLITDIGRLLSLSTDLAQRKKIMELVKLISAIKYLSDAEKKQLFDLEKSGTTSTSAQTLQSQVVPKVSVKRVVAGPQVTKVAKTPVTVAKVSKVSAKAKPSAINISNFKVQINAAGKNYDLLINLCNVGIDALSKVSGVDDKRTLIFTVGEKLILLYNNRGALKKEQIGKLSALFEKAKNTTAFTSYVTDKHINSMKLILQLNVAVAEKDTLKRINLYQQTLSLITKDSDSFECGRLLDGVTSLFSLRKQMNYAEIDALKNLLNTFAKTLKMSTSFSSSTQKIVDEWLKIIECTSVLLSSINSKPIKEQIMVFKSILNNLSISNADYERRLFINAITSLFNVRGNAIQEELESMKTLFLEIQNKAGVLASNQISILILWINELTFALSITTGTKIYVSALLDMAINKRDLNSYEKVLYLITTSTPASFTSDFVIALNNMFKDRNFYDKSKILKFFQSVNVKKLSPVVSLLGPAQKSVMDQWIKILEEEIKATKSANTK